MTRSWIACLAALALAGAAAAEDVDFEDVPRDHWAYEAVQVCARLGIFEGFEGYEVRPDPEARSARVLSDSVGAAGPGERFAPGSIRPRLSDPLAESFARAMEDMQARRLRAARVTLPPRPEAPRRVRREGSGN